MITIKDFAREQGCGESIVYRHIRNHREELGDRVQKVHGRTWLTPEGVQYIKNLMTQHMVIEEKAAPEVKSLQKQIAEQQVTIKAQENIIEMLNLKFERYEEDKKLLEDGKEKIKALEVQNADLSAEKDELKGKIADVEKKASEDVQQAQNELENEKKKREAAEAYADELAEYIALPFFKRLRTKKPVLKNLEEESKE